MKRLILSLSLSVCVWSGSHAEIWTLDSCITYAVSHNIQVKMRALDTYNAELQVTEAKDAFLPQASADVSQSFNFGRGLAADNTYAKRNTAQTGWNIGANIPLFQGMSAIRRLDYAKANLSAIAEQCEAAKDNVELQVIAQYLQVLYCGEMINVALEQLRLSDVQLKRTCVLVEEGKVPELDRTQAESQVAQNELSLVNARNDRTLALLELTQLLQLPTMDNFDIAPIEDSLSEITPAHEVYISALQSNHAIRAGRLSMDAAAKNTELARTGYLPRLSFNLGIGSSYYNVSGIGNPSFGRQMRDNFNTYLGLSLNIPIFDAFSTRNSIRRAKAAETSARLQLDDNESTLYKAICQAYQNAMAAKAKLSAARVAEKATKEALDAMQMKFDFGKATPTELEQSRSEYIRARATAVQSLYELSLRKKILDFYSKD